MWVSCGTALSPRGCGDDQATVPEQKECLSMRASVALISPQIRTYVYVTRFSKWKKKYPATGASQKLSTLGLVGSECDAVSERKPSVVVAISY